jgi:hypothetical protein
MKRASKYGIVLLIVGICGWFIMRHRDRRVDSAISSATLPLNVQEKVIVNQHTHTLTEVTRNEKTGKTEIKKEWLPPTAAIDIFSSGKAAKAQTRKFGTEISPSVGVIYGTDTTMRGEVSLGLLYFERWELGLGLGMGSQFSSARAIANVTYNAYDNILVGIYGDNHRSVGVIVGLRF